MKVRDLPVHTVLPAQRPPFGNLRSRVDVLLAPHGNRLASARAPFVDDSTLTALDIAQRLVWTRRDEPLVSPGFCGVGLLDCHAAVPAGGQHGQTGLSGGVSAASP